MKTSLIFLASFLGVLAGTASAQNIPISLREEVLATYLTIESVSYGELFEITDSSASRFRIVFDLRPGERFMMVEKITYAAQAAKGRIDSPENATLAFIEIFDPLSFHGKGNPTDPRTIVVVEGWKTPILFVLRVDSTRYLVNLSRPSLEEVREIDKDGNDIDSGGVD